MFFVVEEKIDPVINSTRDSHRRGTTVFNIQQHHLERASCMGAPGVKAGLSEIISILELPVKASSRMNITLKQAKFSRHPC